jgi:hypothetical protein
MPSWISEAAAATTCSKDLPTGAMRASRTAPVAASVLSPRHAWQIDHDKMIRGYTRQAWSWSCAEHVRRARSQRSWEMLNVDFLGPHAMSQCRQSRTMAAAHDDQLAKAHAAG